MQFLHGLSRREIAAELHTTEKAAKELIYRGLRLMREMLGPATKYFTDARSVDEFAADERVHAPA